MSGLKKNSLEKNGVRLNSSESTQIGMSVIEKSNLRSNDLKFN